MRRALAQLVPAEFQQKDKKLLSLHVYPVT